MHPEQALFYFLAGITLGSAVLVVTAKNMVRSIFLFFVTLFSIAGLYIFSLADFVALTQVVVYAGGVLVLMLFAFMLSDKDVLNRTAITEAGTRWNLNKAAGFLLAAAVLAIFSWTISHQSFGNDHWTTLPGNQISATDQTTHFIGISLMTRYFLPFETVSVFLLMALIGAVHVSRKEKAP